MKKIIIVGIGETAILAHNYFSCDSDLEVVGFAADQKFITSESFLDLPLVQIENLANKFSNKDFSVFVAIGSSRLNRDRQAVFERLLALQYNFVSYVSSKAYILNNVEIGKNCFILEHNVLQPFTRIGNNVTLWSGNHLGHRSEIEDHVFVSSHCVISGYCKIGARSFLGVNCTIENNVEIATDNFLGSGCIIRKSTQPESLYQIPQTELSKVNPLRLFKVK